MNQVDLSIGDGRPSAICSGHVRVLAEGEDVTAGRASRRPGARWQEVGDRDCDQLRDEQPGGSITVSHGVPISRIRTGVRQGALAAGLPRNVPDSGVRSATPFSRASSN